MSNDLLDLFEAQPANNEPTKDDGFDFDPDGGTTSSVAVTKTTVPAAASEGLGAPASTDRVDPDELRKRIRGEGSERPSSLDRFRSAASGAAGGAVESLRGRVADVSRSKLGAGLLVLLLILCGGLYSIRRASRDAALDDAVIVTGASKVPAKPAIGKASRGSAEAEEEAADEAEAKADGEASEEPSQSRMRGRAASGGSGSWAKEFAAIKGAVADSKAEVLGEIAALRREVARLSARQSSTSSSEEDKSADSSRSRFQANDQPRAAANPYGEVHRESRRSNRAYGSRRRASADAADADAAPRKRAESDEDDEATRAAKARARAWSEGDDDVAEPASRGAAARARSSATADEDESSVGGIREIVTR